MILFHLVIIKIMLIQNRERLWIIMISLSLWFLLKKTSEISIATQINFKIAWTKHTIIQIEITTITKFYNKIIRKMFMQAEVQILDKLLSQNNTITMITSNTIHQISMKISKHTKIKIFFPQIILSNKFINKIIMIP